MGLFDTIVGGSSSPVFLSYQRRNRADFTPLLKYGDYRSKLAQQQAGIMPDIKPTEIKEGLSYTDVAFFENMQQRGMKEVQDVFTKYGNDYAYAVTTPEFKKAVAKVDVPVSDILRLKEEKDKWTAFQSKVGSQEAGDLVYTGDKGLVGAFGAYDPKNKKWVTTTDALQLRQTDPNYAYQVNPDFKMTSTLKRGKDSNEELDKLFGTAKVSEHGDSFIGASDVPWGNSVAAILNNVHQTGGSNKQALNDAILFLQNHITEDAKVGMFNEFLKSSEYMSQFKQKEQVGTLDANEVAQYFMSNYVPNYISQRADAYRVSKFNRTIGTSILDKDKGAYDAMKTKINTYDTYIGGSPEVYNDNQPMNFVMGKNKEGDYDVKTMNVPRGRMHEDDVKFWNKDLISSDGTYTKQANYIGVSAIGANGETIDLDELSGQGWKIANVTGDLLYAPVPTKDSQLQFQGFGNENFVPDPNNPGKLMLKKDAQGNPSLPTTGWMKVTIAADEDDAEDSMKMLMQTDDGKWKEEYAIGDFLNINWAKEPFENKGQLREVTGPNGQTQFYRDIWIPVTNTMMFDPGKKSEWNYVTQKLVEQQKMMGQYNSGKTDNLNDE